MRECLFSTLLPVLNFPLLFPFHVRCVPHIKHFHFPSILFCFPSWMIVTEPSPYTSLAPPLCSPCFFCLWMQDNWTLFISLPSPPFTFISIYGCKITSFFCLRFVFPTFSPSVHGFSLNLILCSWFCILLSLLFTWLTRVLGVYQSCPFSQALKENGIMSLLMNEGFVVGLKSK